MNRKPDPFGLILALGLAAALIGGGGVLVACHVATIGELATVLAAGAVLVAAHRPRPAQTPFRNTFAHGAARLSSEDETHAASAGGNKAADLHAQTFRD